MSSDFIVMTSDGLPLEVAIDVATSEMNPLINISQTPEKRRRNRRRRNKKPADVTGESKIADPSEEPILLPHNQPLQPKTRRRRNRGGAAVVSRGPHVSDVIHEVGKRTDVYSPEGKEAKDNEEHPLNVPDQQHGQQELQLNGSVAVGEQAAPKVRRFYRRSANKKKVAVQNDDKAVEPLQGASSGETTAEAVLKPVYPVKMKTIVKSRKITTVKAMNSEDDVGAELPFGIRLFGRFDCVTCTNSWSSVNAWRGRKQGCKICRSMSEASELQRLFRYRQYPETVKKGSAASGEVVDAASVPKVDDAPSVPADNRKDLVESMSDAFVKVKSVDYKDGSAVNVPDVNEVVRESVAAESVTNDVVGSASLGLDENQVVGPDPKPTVIPRARSRIPHPQDLCEMCIELKYCCRRIRHVDIIEKQNSIKGDDTRKTTAAEDRAGGVLPCEMLPVSENVLALEALASSNDVVVAVAAQN